MKRYFWSLLIALDQLLNAVMGGQPDETISSRCAKLWLEGDGFGCFMCKILDFFQKNHCRKVIELDEGDSVKGSLDLLAENIHWSEVFKGLWKWLTKI